MKIWKLLLIWIQLWKSLTLFVATWIFRGDTNLKTRIIPCCNTKLKKTTSNLIQGQGYIYPSLPASVRGLRNIRSDKPQVSCLEIAIHKTSINGNNANRAICSKTLSFLKIWQAFNFKSCTRSRRRVAPKRSHQDLWFGTLNHSCMDADLWFHTLPATS